MVHLIYANKHMKDINANSSSFKRKNNFKPVAISMAILTGMFVALQAFYFRNSPSMPALQNPVPKGPKF